MPVNPELTIKDLSAQSRALWAKTARDDDSSAWLNLPQHLMDTADVAGILWDEWLPASTRHTISQLCCLTEEQTRKLLRWMAGTHDIGKATKFFQGQLEQRGKPEQHIFAERVRAAGLSLDKYDKHQKVLHSVASYLILGDWLFERYGAPRGTIDSLVYPAQAHHGTTSDIDSNIISLLSRDVREGEHEHEWIEIWDELCEFMTEYTQAHDVLQCIFDEKCKLRVEAQMQMTGLIICADWMASNADIFPLIGGAEPCSQSVRVREGYQALALTRPWEAQAPQLEELDTYLRKAFSWPNTAQARPVQRATASVCEQMQAPGLLIVEAPTGEGKTEAALVAAEICAARWNLGGIFLGAPTMSTSNMLFARIKRWAQRRTSVSDQVLSMFLAHSKAALNNEYEELPRLYISDDESVEERIGENIVASQWLSGRKKGILANFVVGTVDQLLFMALRAKHVMLRHLGFAGKVVIIDEVHAYDAYMSQYLERALTWLARYRVPVILLSATLPIGVKRRLVTAYATGCGNKSLIPLSLSKAYPLITAFSSQEFMEKTVEVPEKEVKDRSAKIKVSFIADEIAELIQQVLKVTAEDGGCVLVLCNTVTRAQETYMAFRDALVADSRRHEDEVCLLHARFAAIDRLEAEEKLMTELGAKAHRSPRQESHDLPINGADSGEVRPRSRILIATQVAEQSLDIDVDLLVTDFAPIDLFLQRVGRLHRHKRNAEDRPAQLQVPQVWIRALKEPKIKDLSAKHPKSDFFDRASLYLYDEYTMMRSYHVLLKHLSRTGGILSRPDDIPELVHATYGSEFPCPCGEGWSEQWAELKTESEKQQERSRMRAKTFAIPDKCNKLPEVFGYDVGEIARNSQSEERGYAQVRDTDPSIEAVLIVKRLSGYQPLPWLCEGENEALSAVYLPDCELPRHLSYILATSTVRLPRRFCIGGTKGSPFDRALAELEKHTPLGWQHDPLLRGMVALELEEIEVLKEGESVKYLQCELLGRTLRYSREVGLYDATSENE
ncbi:CRISPR-associated helicase Cas3' [Schaalia sp. lx-100]|uniref:CRISPR-associated helicase Cas3' n=1 Tax=Schaalia sp. lx-100 TaxID=2899081 RepID=UPI001E3D41DD|nr:CRISPR-associated helicase Cas3' [Schaalia sp. lx-100]MCD4556946.1 CRISPR-associated helicase Cas3' [Schaalia sp. lx-100]